MPSVAQTLLRRGLITAGAASLFLAGCARAAIPSALVVYKTPSCGCCKGWVTHMIRAGYSATINELEDLGPVRARYGVPAALSSCHTATIGGYVIEGHVPPGDVARLIREKPKALGLTVPGMPMGSPGMENAGGAMEKFQTLLIIDRSGSAKVYATHGT